LNGGRNCGFLMSNYPNPTKTMIENGLIEELPFMQNLRRMYDRAEGTPKKGIGRKMQTPSR
jgi:hypothetical protein